MPLARAVVRTFNGTWRVPACAQVFAGFLPEVLHLGGSFRVEPVATRRGADPTADPMCKAKAKEEPPCLYTEERARGDYNARLGYGTDQGRWLLEQVRLGSHGRLSATAPLAPSIVAACCTAASCAAAGGRQGDRQGAQKRPPIAAGLP